MKEETKSERILKWVACSVVYFIMLLWFYSEFLNLQQE